MVKLIGDSDNKSHLYAIGLTLEDLTELQQHKPINTKFDKDIVVICVIKDEEDLRMKLAAMFIIDGKI